MPELTETPDLSLLDRREFTLQLVLAVLSGATITVVSACGGGGGNPSSPSPNPGGGNTNGISGSITGNHGHIATVTNAQLTAANAVAIDIRGGADHPHTIDLTANQVMQIAARQRVSVDSTTDVAHTVIFIG